MDVTKRGIVRGGLRQDLKINEATILILPTGERIEVRFVEIKSCSGKVVSLKITAPQNIKIFREELLTREKP